MNTNLNHCENKIIQTTKQTKSKQTPTIQNLSEIDFRLEVIKMSQTFDPSEYTNSFKNKRDEILSRLTQQNKLNKENKFSNTLFKLIADMKNIETGNNEYLEFTKGKMYQINTEKTMHDKFLTTILVSMNRQDIKDLNKREAGRVYYLSFNSYSIEYLNQLYQLFKSNLILKQSITGYIIAIKTLIDILIDKSQTSIDILILDVRLKNEADLALIDEFNKTIFLIRTKYPKICIINLSMIKSIGRIKQANYNLEKELKVKYFKEDDILNLKFADNELNLFSKKDIIIDVLEEGFIYKEKP